jgi:hypothetical protein
MSSIESQLGLQLIKREGLFCEQIGGSLYYATPQGLDILGRPHLLIEEIIGNAAWTSWEGRQIGELWGYLPRCD